MAQTQEKRVFLLKIAATGFDNNILDTDQISIIRGGSGAFLLLGAVVSAINKRWRDDNKWDAEVISTGSSQALLLITQEAESRVDAFVAELKDQVFIDDTVDSHQKAVPGSEQSIYPSSERAANNTGNELDIRNRHELKLGAAISIVHAVAAGNDFPAALSKVNNACERLQLETLNIPTQNISQTDQQWCLYDGVNPVYGTNQRCWFCDQRWQLGRAIKKKFLTEIFGHDPTGRPSDFDVADSFHEFARKPDQSAYPRVETIETANSLNQKLAYIYFDGNKFSQHFSRESVGSAEDFQTIENALLGYRQKLAEILFQTLPADEHVKDRLIRKEKLALEVLLWGGDETLIVVPAEAALHVLKAISDATAKWQNPITHQHFSHSFAVLVTPSKMQVKLARRLVANLADAAKDTRFKEVEGQNTRELAFGASGNCWSFLGLERVDISLPPEQIVAIHQRRYGEDNANHLLNLDLATLDELKSFEDIEKIASHSQVHRSTHLHNPEKALERLKETQDPQVAALDPAKLIRYWALKDIWFGVDHQPTEVSND